MKHLRSVVLALALAFLVLPAAPFGGILPIPTVGGQAEAYGGPDILCLSLEHCEGGGGGDGGEGGGGGFFHDPCMFDVKLFTFNTCEMCITFSAASWGWSNCSSVGRDRVLGFFRVEETTK